MSANQLPLIGVAAWLAMVGIDFFLHGGLLAHLYQRPGPFLLPPLQAFARIPLGYLSFLLLATLLVWLMARLKVAGWLAGWAFGLKVGALVWGALALGLLSISTADVALLAGWFVGQTVELAAAGAVVGSGLAGVRPGRLFGRVVLGTLALVAITVALQSLGLAPAVHI